MMVHQRPLQKQFPLCYWNNSTVASILLLLLIGVAVPVDAFQLNVKTSMMERINQQRTNRIVKPTTLCSTSDTSVPYIPDPMNNRHSASDWLYNVKSLPESKVLREIRNPVLAVFVWSLCVSTLYTLCSKSSIQLMRSVATHMCIPGTAHSFLVSALGLLLVFRTNSAYQRFNEGRKIWEHILSVSRNMSRMVQLYQNEVGNERLRRIMNLVAAYPYLLRQHIRPGCLCSNNSPNIPEEYRLLLKEQRRTQHETRHEGQKRYKNRRSSTEDDDNDTDLMIHTAATGTNDNIDDQHQPTNTESDCWVDRRALPWSLFMPESLPAISRAENRPLWVCDRMAALICKIPYGPNFTSRERLVLLSMVDKLTNAIGQCERIHQTAVPLNYARHSLRSLTLWLFTLPFALVQDLGLLTAFANAVIAWLFFGVYQIGYSIEDPFQGSLRLSILCDAIRRSVIRQTSGTYPDEDSAYQLSPEECQNIFTSKLTSSSGQSNPNIPEECYLPLKDVIRRSVKDEKSMSLSFEETMVLQQKEHEFKTLQQMVLQHRKQNKNISEAGTANASLPSSGSVTTTTSSHSSQEDDFSKKSIAPSKLAVQPIADAPKSPEPPSSPNSSDASRLTSSEDVESTNASSPSSTAASKTIWTLDEEMLATPKIVTYRNGTWAEVGI